MMFRNILCKEFYKRKQISVEVYNQMMSKQTGAEVLK